MRVEPFGTDSYMHVMKRGARGMPITRDTQDCDRFTKLLYYLNDTHQFDLWERSVVDLPMFERPREWPERTPLVKILAWVLMPNHFHLLLKAISEDGVAKFMQRLCGSMSAHFNAKYAEKGSLFQGAYKSRTIADDRYLRQLAPYIMVKNVFELYPGGYAKALKEFDRAWKWAIEEYPFSSMSKYANEEISPILDKDILGEIFESGDAFRNHAQEVLRSRRVEEDDLLRSLMLDM